VEHADAREGLDQKTYTFSAVNVIRGQPGFYEAKGGVALDRPMREQVICCYVLVKRLWFNGKAAFRRGRNGISSLKSFRYINWLSHLKSDLSQHLSNNNQQHLQSTSSLEPVIGSIYLVEVLRTSYFAFQALLSFSPTPEPIMLLLPEVRSLSLALLLFGAYSTAAPHAGTPLLDRRDDPGTSGADGPTASLEPVVPPEVNPDALSILALGTHVNLAWAGSPADTSSKGMLKRAGAVLTQAAFTFAYPTVPLDHSSFVSGVSCSGNTLTGTLTSTAYTYAKKQWSGAADIVFVTSVDGCGANDANDFFHATKIVFSDAGKSFSATGSSAGYKSVATRMQLKWGDVGTHKLKRAIDKRDVRSYVFLLPLCVYRCDLC